MAQTSTGCLGVEERAALARLRKEVAGLRKDNGFLGKEADGFNAFAQQCLGPFGWDVEVECLPWLGV